MASNADISSLDQLLIRTIRRQLNDQIGKDLTDKEKSFMMLSALTVTNGINNDLLRKSTIKHIINRIGSL